MRSDRTGQPAAIQAAPAVGTGRASGRIQAGGFAERGRCAIILRLGLRLASSGSRGVAVGGDGSRAGRTLLPSERGAFWHGTGGKRCPAESGWAKCNQKRRLLAERHGTAC